MWKILDREALEGYSCQCCTHNWMRWTDLRFYSLWVQTIIWSKTKAVLKNYIVLLLNRKKDNVFFLLLVTAQYLAFCEADWPQATYFSLLNEWWKRTSRDLIFVTAISFLSFSPCTLGYIDVWHIEVCCWTESRYSWKELSLCPKFTTSVADCFCVFYFAHKATILSAHTHHCVTLK